MPALNIANISKSLSEFIQRITILDIPIFEFRF